LFLTLVCATAQVYAFIRRPWFSRAAQIAVVSGSLFAVGLSAGGIPHRGLELARENLESAYLVGEDLKHAVLVRANLTGADLHFASLWDTNLTDTNLTGADLTNAGLQSADLTDANLTGADLTGAYPVYADFTRANLTDANLTDADLTDASNLTQEQLDSACIRKGGEPPALPEGLKPPQRGCVPRVR
jgi:uncharacterized protein YjbI with pentapeptide repeats